MQNFRALGLRPQTLCLRRLGALAPDPQPPGAGALPPDTHWLLAAGAPPPDPQISPSPIANFWLRA